MLVESSPAAQPSQPKHPGPDAIVRQAQRKRLERAHKHHKPVPKGERYGPLGGGTWVRPGCKRVRTDLEGWRLIDAVEWMANRRFVAWSSSDQSVLDELAVRAHCYTDLERRIVVSRPSWLDGLVEELWTGDDKQEPGPGWPRSGGFTRFIADLVHARRSHAVGLWLSQVDAAAVYGVSDRTFRRWIAHAEQRKLVRVIQTWCEDTIRSSNHRKWGKLLYMLGAAVIERSGPALYEGLKLTLPDGRPMQAVAQHAGRKLRRERKAAMRMRHDAIWQAHKISARERKSARAASNRISPSFNCPDMVSRSTRQSRETEGTPVPVVRTNKKTITHTSPHSDAVGSCPQVGQKGKVGPAGRISASPPAPRSGVASPLAKGPTRPRRAIDGQETTTSKLSDPASGPIGGGPTGQAWQGGGDIGEMIAARIKNGFGALLCALLFVSGCSNNDSLFYFFSPDPVTEARDAQNKDEYAKQRDPNRAHPPNRPANGAARPNGQHHPTVTAESRGPLRGPCVVLRGVDRTLRGDPPAGRKTTNANCGGKAVCGPQRAARPAVRVDRKVIYDGLSKQKNAARNAGLRRSRPTVQTGDRERGDEGRESEALEQPSALQLPRNRSASHNLHCGGLRGGLWALQAVVWALYMKTPPIDDESQLRLPGTEPQGDDRRRQELRDACEKWANAASPGGRGGTRGFPRSRKRRKYA